MTESSYFEKKKKSEKRYFRNVVNVGLKDFCHRFKPQIDLWIILRWQISSTGYHEHV